MIGKLGRRVVESVVLLFALLGFLFVPLGRRTGFEHARAVLATGAAREAITETTTAIYGLKSRVLEVFTTPEPDHVASTPPRQKKKPLHPTGTVPVGTK